MSNKRRIRRLPRYARDVARWPRSSSLGRLASCRCSMMPGVPSGRGKIVTARRSSNRRSSWSTRFGREREGEEEMGRYNHALAEADRREAYRAYLRSEAWQEKRELVLARDHHWCQGCFKRPATHVHHLRY
jgi:hypothetical protein